MTYDQPWRLTEKVTNCDKLILATTWLLVAPQWDPENLVELSVPIDTWAGALPAFLAELGMEPDELGKLNGGTIEVLKFLELGKHTNIWGRIEGGRIHLTPIGCTLGLMCAIELGLAEIDDAV